jgi:hypothetical protein
MAANWNLNVVFINYTNTSRGRRFPPNVQAHWCRTKEAANAATTALRHPVQADRWAISLLYPSGLRHSEPLLYSATQRSAELGDKSRERSLRWCESPCT